MQGKKRLLFLIESNFRQYFKLLSRGSLKVLLVLSQTIISLLKVTIALRVCKIVSGETNIPPETNN